MKHKFSSTRLGDITFLPTDIYTFPLGLIGFPELQSFALIEAKKEAPFWWLQSLDDPTIAFMILRPELFKKGYEAKLKNEDLADLQIDKDDIPNIMVIITMPTNPNEATANLKAPLAVNLNKRIGKQIIMDNKDYNTRHKIMDTIRECV